MRRLAEALAALAAALFVVGPLAHLALHRDDHVHLPGGGVRYVEPHAHAHPHDHEHPHEHPHDDPDPTHGDGSVAHLGLAPPPPTPVLVPPRPTVGPYVAPPVRPPEYRGLIGHSPPRRPRARAPPA